MLAAVAKSLAIVDQRLDGGAAAISEDIHCARKWVGLQLLFAYPRQTVDAAAKVNCLDRDQDAHLRRQLDHRVEDQKTLLRAVRSGAALPRK
jgi:hypothetical protein